MFNLPIRSVMEHHKVLTAPPETCVSEAAELMASRNVGAVMVIEQERLVGIFTERDAVFRVIAKGRDARSTRLAEVMMHEHGFRHVPVIENGKPIGIISARNALDPDLEEFVSEAQRRKHIQAIR